MVAISGWTSAPRREPLHAFITRPINQCSQWGNDTLREVKLVCQIQHANKAQIYQIEPKSSVALCGTFVINYSKGELYYHI